MGRVRPVRSLFDSPRAGDDAELWALAGWVVLYPLPIVVGNALFWIFRRRHSVRALGAYTALSVIHPVIAAMGAATVAWFVR